MINIKATNIELSGAINSYLNKRLDSIKKFAKGSEMSGYIEVGKTTQHHNKGEVFMAEFNINFNGDNFFTVSEKEDLYLAIDDAKEEIIRKITQSKNRKRTLFKRGAVSIKKMIKGISDRNPFTSK